MPTMNYSIILSVIMCVVCLVVPSAGIKCYQCSDSGNDETSACIRGTHSLSLERGAFERENKSISKYPRLKECDNYVDPITGYPRFSYCKTETISSGGVLNAFIRDCSNGLDFSEDLNMSRLAFNKYLFPDNQSTCGYSHGHLANICVQVCMGDFCNGPFAGHSVTVVYNKTLTAILAVILLVRSSLIF